MSRIVFAALLLGPGHGGAETLQVVIADDVQRNLSPLAERVQAALAESEHSFEIRVLPNKRSFQTLINGGAAMELVRTTVRLENYPQLTAIQPPVARVGFQMIVAKDSAQLCDAPESRFASLSIAGVIGVDVHSDYYYSRFRHRSELTSFPRAWRYVGLGRADVTFLPQPVVGKIPPEDKLQLEVCAERIDYFPLHSILHQDYLWARDDIEAAYRKIFGKK